MLPSKIGTSLHVVVIKTAPEEDLKGETYFYKTVQTIPSLQPLFPTYYGSSPGKLKIKYIHSIPFTHLYTTKQLTADHLTVAFKTLDALHACTDVKVTITPAQIKDAYISKLTHRISGPEYMPLPEVSGVYAELLRHLKVYMPTSVPVIHGDAWFANLLWTYDNRIKCVDMRGRIGNTLTLNGDPNYDYAKMYQSLLGFDEVVFGLTPVDKEYRSHIVGLFLDHLRLRNVNVEDVFLITLCNMVGSIPFHIRRAELWSLIQTLLRT